MAVGCLEQTKGSGDEPSRLSRFLRSEPRGLDVWSAARRRPSSRAGARADLPPRWIVVCPRKGFAMYGDTLRLRRDGARRGAP